MRTLPIPYFIGKKTPIFEKEVERIYSNEFLTKIYERLNISKDRQKEFAKFLKFTSTSYLSAKDMNAGRIQPNQQKNIYKNYVKCLQRTKKQYQEIIKHGSANNNFHDSLKDLLEKTEEPGMKEMFHPYIGLEANGKLGGVAITLFEKFFNVLIEAAENAPSYINENDKANIEGEHILWWLNKMGMNWERFTDIPFVLGDWFSNEDLGLSDSENPDKKGLYFSECIGILYDLLNAVDKKITRADVETAMRKYKKIN